jgi:DNA gyrase/topoisomerase IV subunit B
VTDRKATDDTIQRLMGREVKPRFELIMERAPKIGELDV